MLAGKARLIETSTTIEGKSYSRFLLHIPSKITGDSQFPFEPGDALKMEVDPKKKTMLLSKLSGPKATPRKRGSTSL